MTSPVSGNHQAGYPPSQLPAGAKPQRHVQQALEQLSPAGAMQTTLGREDLVKPLQRINEALRPYNVQFELNKEAGKVVTRVIDMENGEEIRQIPSDAVLEIAKRLHELRGLLLKEQG